MLRIAIFELCAFFPATLAPKLFIHNASGWTRYEYICPVIHTKEVIFQYITILSITPCLI